MLFRLVRPVRRKGSSFQQFVQRIPADVLPRARGLKLTVPLGKGEVHHLTVSDKARDVRFSLRSRDPSVIKARQGAAAAYLEGVWRNLRATEPTTLTNRQATALAGDLYRAWADGESRERTTTIEIDLTTRRSMPVQVSPEEEEAGFREAAASLVARIVAGDDTSLEDALGPIIARLLLSRGISAVDPSSRLLLLNAFAKALRDAFEVRARNAAGDYRSDPNAERFPRWEAPSERKAAERPTQGSGTRSLTGLVEDWWKEAQAAGRKRSTYDNYRNSIALLVALLGHDDAGRMTPEDIVRFKEHRLAAKSTRTGKPVSARTIKDGDLAAFKTVFGWAMANRRLPTNPAAGITIKLAKPAKLRAKGFTAREAAALLSAALQCENRSDAPRTAAAKRWVPWLCAYTGARVGEMAQLRKEDLRREGVVWVLRITPEAGTVKTNEAREVPLHADLVEQGFPTIVAEAPAGHLFLKLDKGADVRGPWRGLKNRLAEFGRRYVTDPNVAPNHGWRHRFKTVGLEAGIDHRVLDAIQGQQPRSVAETYGEVTLKTMVAAIQRLPRIEIGPRGREG